MEVFLGQVQTTIIFSWAVRRYKCWIHVGTNGFFLPVNDLLCPVREKLVQLEPVDLKEHRDPVERLELQDLLDLLAHRFVCHHSF